jgi:hypothetical protein
LCYIVAVNKAFIHSKKKMLDVMLEHDPIILV